jgi:hypothetical protein
LLRHGNNEESFFGEFLDFLGGLHELIKFFNGEFGLGLVGKEVVKEIT